MDLQEVGTTLIAIGVLVWIYFAAFFLPFGITPPIWGLLGSFLAILLGLFIFLWPDRAEDTALSGI